jgi:hypothetical protein
VVFESRGGTRGSDAERNADYAPGLELLLGRLRDAGLRIEDLLVESRDTASLPLDERRLRGKPYPIVIEDVTTVRKWMTAAQAKVGRAPGAKGAGNSTRRLRLIVGPMRDDLDAEALGARLQGGPSS